MNQCARFHAVLITMQGRDREISIGFVAVRFDLLLDSPQNATYSSRPQLNPNLVVAQLESHGQSALNIEGRIYEEMRSAVRVRNLSVRYAVARTNRRCGASRYYQ